MCSQYHLRDYNIFHHCAATSHKKIFSNIVVTLAVLKFFLHFSSFASWLCHICFVCVGYTPRTLPRSGKHPISLACRFTWRQPGSLNGENALLYDFMLHKFIFRFLNWTKYSARSLKVVQDYTVRFYTEILHSSIFCTNVEVERIL